MYILYIYIDIYIEMFIYVKFKLPILIFGDGHVNILTHIINDDQTGFIPGRLMASNIRMVYDMLFYSEKNNIHGLLLLIDFTAAV